MLCMLSLLDMEYTTKAAKGFKITSDTIIISLYMSLCDISCI